MKIICLREIRQLPKIRKYFTRSSVSRRCDDDQPYGERGILALCPQLRPWELEEPGREHLFTHGKVLSRHGPHLLLAGGKVVTRGGRYFLILMEEKKEGEGEDFCDMELV